MRLRKTHSTKNLSSDSVLDLRKTKKKILRMKSTLKVIKPIKRRRRRKRRKEALSGRLTRKGSDPITASLK